MTGRAILIVDDDLDFLEVARTIFEEASSPFAVHTATTGAQALSVLARLADSSCPTLMVLDMRLPDMTAGDVLRQCALDARRIPVLVLTQALWRVDEAAARDAGACEVYEKPGKLAALRTLLLDFACSTLVEPSANR